MSTILNRASTKKYALKVSTERRANKFVRVSQDFFQRCEARLENEIRGLGSAPYDSNIPNSEPLLFVTKLARLRAQEKLEAAAQRIIYSEVMKHPSLGKTLK